MATTDFDELKEGGSVFSLAFRLYTMP